MRRLAVVLLVVAACGADAAGLDPPDIDWGRDLCTSCGMIISDPRYAAAYAVAGDDRLFDDIGDMIDFGLGRGELHSRTPAWVHDHDSGEWLEAASAHYVVTPAILTPMGRGIAAFSTADRARAFAGEFGGETMTWEDLLVRLTPGED